MGLLNIILRIALREKLSVREITFLQHERLQSAKREKRTKRQKITPPEPTLPAVRRAIIAALMLSQTPIRCPPCQNQIRSRLFNLPKAELGG